MKKVIWFTLLLLSQQSAHAALPYAGEYDGNYYKIYSFWDLGWRPGEARMTWNQAETYAQSLVVDGVHGNLASVTNAGEDNFLWSIGSQGTFIGGYQQTNGNWAWVDGNAFSYTNWVPGEPYSWHGLYEPDLMYWWNDTGTSNIGWSNTTPDSGYFDTDINAVRYVTWGFTVEFLGASVPEPETVLTFGLGLALIGMKLARKTEVSAI